MYQNNIEYNSNSHALKQHSINSDNNLGIRNTSFVWDRKRQRLILLLETSQMVSREINAIVKGNRLILEAPLLSSYNKPFRTHLIGREIKNEFDEGLTEIGFSELKLKLGYHYNLVSCQTIDSKLIKVILGYTLWGRKKNN